MGIIIKDIKIDGYTFDLVTNQYDYISEIVPSITLDDISKHIGLEIDNLFEKQNLLIRGIQSGKHDLSKDDLVQEIVNNGREYENTTEPDTIFAAPYERAVTVQHILEGFHKYKPKSEERPQHPVDIWMIFDSRAYENVEYLHPRHNVLARDKWKRVNPTKTGLLGAIVIR